MRIRMGFLVLLLGLLLAACQGRGGSDENPIYESIAPQTIKTGDPIPAPSGEVILTIDGKISQQNADGTLQFDLATLEQLGVEQYDVTDPFSRQKVNYAGVPMERLLEVIGASSDATTLEVTALDNYSTEIQIADVRKWPVLLATRVDGELLPLQRAPTYVIWPFDDYPDIDKLLYEPKWAWSVSRITVR